MNQTSKVISVVALIIVIVAGVWIYRIIYPPEPPQVEVTNQALEAAKLYFAERLYVKQQTVAKENLS